MRMMIWRRRIPYSTTAYILLKWSSMLDARRICNRQNSLFSMLMLYMNSSSIRSFSPSTDLHVTFPVGYVHHIFTMQYLMKFYFKGSHKLHEYHICVCKFLACILLLCDYTQLTKLFPCRNARVAVSVNGSALESLTAIREALDENVINYSSWGLQAWDQNSRRALPT